MTTGGYRRAVIELLEANGFRQLPKRGKGSHEIWAKGNIHQTVPQNIDDRHFANRLLRKAGIKQQIQ